MTTNYHTEIVRGAAANASTFNSPLAELDEAITNLVGGGSVTDQTLAEWVEGEDFEATALTRNTAGVVTSATVKWPDGSAGTFTATTVNGTWDAIDAYTITHTDSGKTVTQAAVTRDANGNITAKPALTVA
jgi:hypothetical protein